VLLPFSPVVHHYSRGHVTPAQVHAWPQLLYASHGVMAVETDSGPWVVPPQRAVWVPPSPMPIEPCLMGLCRQIISQPSTHISLNDYARGVGLTPKTALRLFYRELGMNFRQWRQLVQTAYAVAHLAQGEPMKVIASQLGYSTGAFSVMLRRNIGKNLGKGPQSLRPPSRRAPLREPKVAKSD
jgi:AraC-like DNA-binding protein